MANYLLTNFTKSCCKCSVKTSHQVLQSLHWLPVQMWVLFNLLTYHSYHGLGPTYINELIIPYQHTLSLRSADRHLFHAPMSGQKTFGDHTFSVAAPRDGNKLPLSIRQTSSIKLFKSSLKTSLLNHILNDSFKIYYCYFFIIIY